jgi:isoleucyl-tRNA synthetase
MSTKFTEYKGLDSCQPASEVRFLKKENIFEKSVTTREGNTPRIFFEGPLGKWIEFTM